MRSFFKRYPVALWPIACAMAILLLVAGGIVVRHALRLDLDLTWNGEWFRVLTAHWVHLGWQHGLLNAGGFLLVAWVYPKGHWLAWIGFYVFSSICISSVLLFDDSISSYVGASGVLHGLLILAAYFSRWLEPWRRYLMIAVICAKLIWEQSPWYSDVSVGAVIGGNIATNAHLIGGLCGLLIIVIYLLKMRLIPNR